MIILVAFFSFLSGYFTVLIYEYAAAGLEKGAQTSATRLLNLCFQVCVCVCVYVCVCVCVCVCVTIITKMKMFHAISMAECRNV